MSILGWFFGNPTGGILDDKAERIFARRVGLATIIAATGFALGCVVLSLRCG